MQVSRGAKGKDRLSGDFLRDSSLPNRDSAGVGLYNRRVGELSAELSQLLEESRAKGGRGLSRCVELALRTSPAAVRNLLESFGPAAVEEAPGLWRTSLAATGRRLRSILEDVPGRGLDAIMTDLFDLVAAVWVLESSGALWKADDEGIPVINRFFESLESPLRHLAPPPPKKIKLDAPQRKILPLSEARVAPAFDTIMLLQGLLEIGDFTRVPDRAREKHYLFLDDWRRLVWESARIDSWARTRELVLAAPPIEDLIPGRRFSREAALALLEANHRHRQDLITPLPNVSMLACQKCGRFEGRERTRCEVCRKMFCGRCRARQSELCLGDYARPRFAKLPVDARTSAAAAARKICARFRLDEHTRDEAFVRALAEMGIEVAFADSNPAEGQEGVDAKGKWHFRLRHHEQASTKRLLFAAIARAHFRSTGATHDPDLEAYFVDICLNVPVEDALLGESS